MKIDYYTAVGCPPCQTLWPHVEAACQEFGVTLNRIELQLNCAASFDRARAADVTRTPTMIAYDDAGIEIGRQVGAVGQIAARGLIKLWSYL